MLSDDFRDLFEEKGYPTKYSHLSSDELEFMVGKFPEFMVDLYREFGRFLLGDGVLQVCHPKDLSGILALIFGADADFNHKECHAFAYSSFGNIYFWNRKKGTGVIYIQKGEVICRGVTKGVPENSKIENTIYTPFEIESELYDFYDENDKPLFKRALKKYGPLEIGECYGFVPALALGGIADIGHIKRMSAPAHFSIVAQTMNFNLIDVQGYGKSVIIRPIG